MLGEHRGRWLVLGEAARDRYGNRKWKCRCECGVISIVYQNALRGGQSTQCGLCSRRSTVGARAASTRTHGMSRTPTYRVWEAMIRRCRNVSDGAYQHYGGRGITVCPEWIGDGGFERFLACLGVLPKRGYTIDRIDVDGNYEPGNVRWATKSEQARNRRNNRLISFGGRELCLAAWAVETGLSRETISRRLERGWSAERSLTVPVTGV